MLDRARDNTVSPKPVSLNPAWLTSLEGKAIVISVHLRPRRIQKALDRAAHFTVI